jgi:secreted PhoX family phosphatase
MSSSTNRPTSRQSEESENVGSNDTANPTLGDVIAERLSRRDLMKGILAVTAIGATVAPMAVHAARARTAAAGATAPRFNFAEVGAGVDEKHYVAEGYDADVLIRWGDPVLPGAPAFDPLKQTASAQALQFGYNNDFLGFIPLNGAPDHGLLVVNHEYTNEELMFPASDRDKWADAADGLSKALAEIEMMAHGGSVLEVRRTAGKWAVISGSEYARRIAAETVMRISGPAAGHARMKTAEDPTGMRVRGMLNNCAGGLTPWGTWLSCEENFNGYFWGKAAAQASPDAAALKRYGAPGERQNWGVWFDRFDIEKEPNEVNRFGWVVEIDPMDPHSVPVKRTAMGRFKHEGAASIVNGDGRFVVYQGDDERGDYVYKFVTEGRVDPASREANRDLLDKGTLYVARYNADGTGEWLPLIHGVGPLTPANGFADQGEVVIYARLAADMLGATKMDRPEDVEASPQTGKVYVMLTNNDKRAADEVDAANPRAENTFGHIIEMTLDGGDHAGTTFTWEILVKCGDPAIAEVGSTFNPATSEDGWFGMPDNCAVDAMGRLWIATDGNSARKTGRADGLWALETEGQARAMSKLFFRCPAGAELCGPMPTPDLETFFVAIQHPGEAGDGKHPATFETPATRWPDFKPDMPPRPSVVAITRRGGGKIAV